MRRYFTDSEDEQIVKIYQSGIGATDIASAYGVSYPVIYGALKRQHVPRRHISDAKRLISPTINPHVFDTIDSESAAYWYGFLWADGCVHQNRLSVSLSMKDITHLQELMRFLGSNAEPRHVIFTSTGKDHAGVTFTVRDRILTDRLVQLGIVPYRKSEINPLSMVPTEFIRHWLRGFFDGDGSARLGTKGPSFCFLGTQPLLRNALDILSTEVDANPNLSIRQPHGANIFALYVSGLACCLRVANYLYTGATIYMLRKREVIDRWSLWHRPSQATSRAHATNASRSGIVSQPFAVR